MNVRQRQPRERDEAYLAYVRTLPCLICANPFCTEAAHIRAPSLEHGKRYTGKAEKPSDCWAVPLCSHHHREQHRGDELAWWASYGLDPFPIAVELYARFRAGKPKPEPRKRERKTEPRKPKADRRKVPAGKKLESRSSFPPPGSRRLPTRTREKERLS